MILAIQRHEFHGLMDGAAGDTILKKTIRTRSYLERQIDVEATIDVEEYLHDVSAVSHPVAALLPSPE